MIANANTTTDTPAPEITAALDRSTINHEGGSVRHLVITVKAPLLPPTDEPRQPLNLGLVIDASGSMSGPPLEAAKAATRALLEKLATTDHLSLISFASDVVVHAEAVKLDGEGRAEIGRALRPLVTRGSTDLFAGWVSGCEAVAKRQAAADVLERNHVILLSDGHANQGETDPTRLAHHAGELRRRGVLTSTVGIGSHYSPIQLQAISEAGGGRMHDAELPDEIAEIMFAELTDALATTVESLELAIRLPQGVEAEIYGPTPLNRDAEGCEVLVGSMIAGGLRQVVVKLKFLSGQAGDTLPVAVSARWKTPGQEAVQSAEVATLAVSFDTPAACLAQPRSREIARIAAEQWQAHIYHRALMLNQDGQYEAAHAFVERERRFFDRYCHDLPEMRSSVHEVHAFAPTVHRAYQVISSKEMLLHAYKTSRGETDRRRRKRRDTSAYIAEEAARQRGES
jgi:Ca-activated chloride channel family protein